VSADKLVSTSLESTAWEMGKLLDAKIGPGACSAISFQVIDLSS
jgi:hypothetical protein